MQTQERVGTLQHPQLVQQVIDQDLIACLLFNSLARAYNKLLLSHDMVPYPIRNAAARVVGEINAMDDKVSLHSPKTRVRVSNQAMSDAGTLIQLISKIGNTVEDHEYTELFNLIVTCIDSVLYAQEHKKKIHIGKYKALIRLIADEMKRDTNHETPMVLYRKDPKHPHGELFMRASVPDCKSEIL